MQPCFSSGARYLRNKIVAAGATYGGIPRRLGPSKRERIGFHDAVTRTVNEIPAESLCPRGCRYPALHQSLFKTVWGRKRIEGCFELASCSLSVGALFILCSDVGLDLCLS